MRIGDLVILNPGGRRIGFEPRRRYRYRVFKIVARGFNYHWRIANVEGKEFRIRDGGYDFACDEDELLYALGPW